MGLPFWEMPDHLLIDGRRYAIRTDFRVGIRIRQMLWDPYYAAHPAALLDGIRHLLFVGDASACEASACDASACDDAALLVAVVWYLLDGRVELHRIAGRLAGAADGSPAAASGSTSDASGSKPAAAEPKADASAAKADAASRMRAVMDEGDPVFSYLWDTPALYAAFLQVYRVNLLEAEMHLWQFDALFASLPDDCALSRTMALRALPLQSAEDGDARAALAAGKLARRIPDADTLHRITLCAAQETTGAVQA